MSAPLYFPFFNFILLVIKLLSCKEKKSPADHISITFTEVCTLVSGTTQNVR